MRLTVDTRADGPLTEKELRAMTSLLNRHLDNLSPKNPQRFDLPAVPPTNHVLVAELETVNNRLYTHYHPGTYLIRG